MPDGGLHESFPFESLLVEGRRARYLLDVLPPIAYAPSATILLEISRPVPPPPWIVPRPC